MTGAGRGESVKGVGRVKKLTDKQLSIIAIVSGLIGSSSGIIALLMRAGLI